MARPEPGLGGIPLAVKDLFDTAGLVTTYGSAIFADHVPGSTAEGVLRLEAAGWANVGKTNLHEFAYGTTSQNVHFGTVPNPAAPGRVAGGSSGGNAAALALGLADGAIGTDSGGSVRIPAACCEVVGFKPTFGLVPLDGCFPLAPSFDHAGPMARTVGECARMLEALAPPFRAPPPLGLEDVKVAVAWLEHADPLVAACVDAAAALFPNRERLDLPLLDGVGPLFMREVADVHRELFAEHAELYGSNVAGKFEACMAVTDAEVAAAERTRAEYRERIAAALDGYDLLLTPTLPCVPPPADVDEVDVRPHLIRFTLPLNALGWPALALPAGRAEEGLPASVQLAARAGEDALVLAAGQALETALRPL